MNKIIKMFISLAISIFLLPSFSLAASTTDYFNRRFISTYGYVDTKDKHGNFEWFNRASDNKIAYCIEPGVSLSESKYDGYYDLPLSDLASIADLSEKRLNKAALYAYFGYGYHGHSGEDWVMATQALIWDAVGRNFQFTDGYHPDNPKDYIIDIPSEVQKKIEYIEEKVDDYLEKPDFYTNHAYISKNATYNFGKLHGYKVLSCENCNYEIKNDYLMITPTNELGGVISLEKKLDDYKSSFFVYAKDDGQNMMVPGNVEPLNMEVSYEVVSGSFKLFKYDFDSKSCKAKEGGSLSGSVYKLYKDDNTFIADLVIGDDCTAQISDLELGSYYIKEEKAGLNYELDTNTYSFIISKDNLNQELTVYDKMYLGKVKLKKVDSKTNTCKSSGYNASLKNAIYGIYDDNDNLIDKLVTDTDCGAESKRNLLLGRYYLKEIEAPTGYKLDLEKHYFEVTRNNADDIIELELKDNIYETKLILDKNYLYFTSFLPESDAVFLLLRKETLEVIDTLKTNELGYVEKTLEYGNYILKQISGKEGYRFTNDLEIIVDENSDFETKISLTNEPFRGTLKFLKTDMLTGEPLKNVFIEIYNELNDLVYKGFTNKDGEIILSNLAYGKYYLIETKPLKGYYPNNNIIDFQITTDDEIVNVSLENEQIVNVPDTYKETNSSSVYGFILFFLGVSLISYGKKVY